MNDSEMKDLADLLFADFCKYQLYENQVIPVVDWCNEQFGDDGWSYTNGVFSFSNIGDSTLFLLRWA